MDDEKAPKLKTEEALAMAMRWEKQSPMPGSDRSAKGSTASGQSTSDAVAAAAAVAATNGTAPPPVCTSLSRNWVCLPVGESVPFPWF